MNSANVSAVAIAKQWLTEMETCVRSADFARARLIFADDVVGFGTVASIADSLAELETDQWRSVWGHIQDFTFDLDGLACGGDDTYIWIACPWTSRRQDATGDWIERPGRMTAVLERRGQRWLAVHTHHSLNPVKV